MPVLFSFRNYKTKLNMHACTYAIVCTSEMPIATKNAALNTCIIIITVVFSGQRMKSLQCTHSHSPGP